jgi:hypothetical protein
MRFLEEKAIEILNTGAAALAFGTTYSGETRSTLDYRRNQEKTGEKNRSPLYATVR